MSLEMRGAHYACSLPNSQIHNQKNCKSGIGVIYIFFLFQVSLEFALTVCEVFFLCLCFVFFLTQINTDTVAVLAAVYTLSRVFDTCLHICTCNIKNWQSKRKNLKRRSQAEEGIQKNIKERQSTIKNDKLLLKKVPLKKFPDRTRPASSQNNLRKSNKLISKQ